MHRNHPQPEQRPRGEIQELLKGQNWDKGSMGYLAKGIQKAVSRSMIMEPTLRLDLGLEERRRTLTCIDLFRIMTGDMKWSPTRAADELPRYLLKKLRQEPIDFSERSSWGGPGNSTGGNRNGN